jgi:hypothetical protein
VITRPPSAQRPYETYYSGDPAFVQPPKAPADDASDEAKKEYTDALEQHGAKVKSARDTGNWQALIVEGQSPTKFVMAQVDRGVWRELADRMILPPDSHRRVGIVTLRALAFRLAIKSIGGWDKFERLPDPSWDNWTMAPEDIVAELDAIDAGIVNEIGTDVLERLRGGVRPL